MASTGQRKMTSAQAGYRRFERIIGQLQPVTDGYTFARAIYV